MLTLYCSTFAFVICLFKKRVQITRSTYVNCVFICCHAADRTILSDLETVTCRSNCLLMVDVALVAGPTVWNSLPDNLRNPTLSLTVFKRYLVSYLHVINIAMRYQVKHSVTACTLQFFYCHCHYRPHNLSVMQPTTSKYNTKCVQWCNCSSQPTATTQNIPIKVEVTPGSQMFRHSWRRAQIDRAGCRVLSPTPSYQFQRVLRTSKHNCLSAELLFQHERTVYNIQTTDHHINTSIQFINHITSHVQQYTQVFSGKKASQNNSIIKNSTGMNWFCEHSPTVIWECLQ